ncbi:unnamed protein product, partial [Rotaria sp. Silwood2]
MAICVTVDDEQQRLQKQNIPHLRELHLMKLNEDEEIIAREELKKYDEEQSELERLDDLDSYKSRMEINDLKEQIKKAEIERESLNKQCEEYRTEHEKKIADLEKLTLDLAQRTKEIQQFQEQVRNLRQQKHLLTVEQDKLQRMLIEDQQLFELEN